MMYGETLRAACIMNRDSNISRMAGTFNKYLKRNNVTAFFRLFVVRNWLWLPVTLFYYLHLNVIRINVGFVYSLHCRKLGTDLGLCSISNY